MSKILLTGRKFGDVKRSGHVISERIAELFPETFDYVEQGEFNDWHEALGDYKKIIFMTHSPRTYFKAPNFVDLSEIPHMIYMREEFNSPFYNSVTNGFNYYMQHESIKNYVPLVTPPPSTFATNRSRPVIGYYLRANLLTQSMKQFINELEALKDEVDVFILGEKCYDFSQIKNVKHCDHTNDASRFFSYITHFVYPRNDEFADPFPHTLLEAVNLNKQIIIPDIRTNSLRDGIDDIRDMIDYHDKIDFNSYFDNKDCVLTFENFKGFYNEIIKNDFEYSFDRKKFKSLSQWIGKEVLPLR